MTDSVDLTRRHDFVDGHLVSVEVQRVVQAIREYSDELDVQWLPPAARTQGQAAYAIIHRPPNGADYVLFYVKNDEDFDERVLFRIIANDQRNGVVQLSEYEAWEQAQKRVAHQKFLDSIEEANDIAAFALKTKLNTYTVPTPNGGVMKIRE